MLPSRAERFTFEHAAKDERRNADLERRSYGNGRICSVPVRDLSDATTPTRIEPDDPDTAGLLRVAERSANATLWRSHWWATESSRHRRVVVFVAVPDAPGA